MPAEDAIRCNELALGLGVLRTIEDYRLGRADFADYLIGNRNRAAGCSDTASFDTGLADAAGLSAR